MNTGARDRASALGLRVIDRDDCKCHRPPILYTDYRDVRELDEDCWFTVTSEVCRFCGATWLHVKYETSISHSGRWWRGIVSPEIAASATAENALDILDGLAWHLVGGGHFSSWGYRSERPTERP
jgi:hypothetical protein